MTLPNCPFCQQPVGMRTNWPVMGVCPFPPSINPSVICEHECHRLAQAVLEAAVAVEMHSGSCMAAVDMSDQKAVERIRGEMMRQSPTVELRRATVALLAELQEEEKSDAE